VRAVLKPRSDGRLRTMGRSSSLRFVIGQQEMCLRQPTAKTAQEQAAIEAVLRANPNIKRLAPFGDEQFKLLASSAWKQCVERGRNVMEDGDLNNASFFIVASGSFEVSASELFDVVTLKDMSYLSRPKLEPAQATDKWRSDEKVKTVRRVGPNTCFGDSSMLYNAPRWTTVTALGPSSVWVISQANFKIAQIQATQPMPSEKSPADEKLIADALRANKNLRRLTGLGSTHIRELVSAAWKEVVPQGHVLMREGDLNADALYIVGDGLLELVGSEPFEVVSHGEVSYLSRAAHSGEELSKPAFSFGPPGLRAASPRPTPPIFDMTTKFKIQPPGVAGTKVAAGGKFDPKEAMPAGMDAYMTQDQYEKCINDVNEIIDTKSSVGEGAGAMIGAVLTFGISTKFTNTVDPAMKAYDGFPGLKITSYFGGNQYGGKHFMLEKK